MVARDWMITKSWQVWFKGKQKASRKSTPHDDIHTMITKASKFLFRSPEKHRKQFIKNTNPAFPKHNIYELQTYISWARLSGGGNWKPTIPIDNPSFSHPSYFIIRVKLDINVSSSDGWRNYFHSLNETPGKETNVKKIPLKPIVGREWRRKSRSRLCFRATSPRMKNPIKWWNCVIVSASDSTQTSFKCHQKWDWWGMKSQWNLFRILIDFSFASICISTSSTPVRRLEGKWMSTELLTEGNQNKLESSLVTFKSICTCISVN